MQLRKSDLIIISPIVLIGFIFFLIHILEITWILKRVDWRMASILFLMIYSPLVVLVGSYQAYYDNKKVFMQYARDNDWSYKAKDGLKAHLIQGTRHKRKISAWINQDLMKRRRDVSIQINETTYSYPLGIFLDINSEQLKRYIEDALRGK